MKGALSLLLPYHDGSTKVGVCPYACVSRLSTGYAKRKQASRLGGREMEGTCGGGLGAGEDQESRRKPSSKLDGVSVGESFGVNSKNLRF